MNVNYGESFNLLDSNIPPSPPDRTVGRPGTPVGTADLVLDTAALVARPLAAALALVDCISAVVMDELVGMKNYLSEGFRKGFAGESNLRLSRVAGRSGRRRGE